MSNIYHTEPPTQGKVLLKTSGGDIDIEIWPKEAPLACRNFVQLCLEGYYDGCPIHRVVKDFMIQTGDPTGLGTGGSSIWGRPFKDEPHGRIKFNHRGQVAMANENKPNTNQSQFFITLGPCEWIDRKHTIFGKVTGNTIYNVTRMGEVEVDSKDRPIDPLKIIKTEVLWNPFDDIIPRQTSKPTTKPDANADNIKAKPVRKAVRDSKLVSFGEEDEDIGVANSSKSIVQKLVTTRVTMPPSSMPALTNDILSDSGPSGAVACSSEPSDSAQLLPVDKFSAKLVQSLIQKRRGREKPQLDYDNDDAESSPQPNNRHTSSISSSSTGSVHMMQRMYEQEEFVRKEGELSSRSEEFQRLREELIASKRAIKVLTGAEADKMNAAASKNEVLSLVEQRRQKYLKRKNDYGDRQEETMKKLQNFTKLLRNEKKAATSTTNESNEIAESRPTATADAYNGQILELDSDDDISSDWHVGKLKCRKHIDDQFRSGEAVEVRGKLGGDGRSGDDYLVTDIRLGTGSRSV